jgi:predicted deacylase
MKKYIVAALHGDETFGLRIVGHMQESISENICFRVGHPEAVAKNVRLIETDLNRSFLSESTSLEGRLAAHIKQEIVKCNPDLIVDIHTAEENVGNVAIVANLNSLVVSVAEQLGMDAVVKMPENLAKKSLIGCFPEKSLSLEFTRTRCTDELAKSIALRLSTVRIPGSRELSTKLPVFEVISVIDKNYSGLKDIVNLSYNKELKGYPFLASPTAYDMIGGFLANKIVNTY